MLWIDAVPPQYGARGAYVVAHSAHSFETMATWPYANPIRYLVLSDFRRQMLPGYGAMATNEQSPIFRYAKRAYFIIDKNGVLRWQNIKANPLDLLDPDEVLKALKELGT